MDNEEVSFEFYDEPVDKEVYGWEWTSNYCPECGHKGIYIREHDYNDIMEIQKECEHCGWADNYIE